MPDQVHVSVSGSQFVDGHQRDINLLALAEVNLGPECMRCDALCGSRFRDNNIGNNGHTVQSVKLNGELRKDMSVLAAIGCRSF